MKILISIFVVLLTTLANGELTLEPGTTLVTTAPTKLTTTAAPTTAAPTTAAPTTAAPTTAAPTTAAPTTGPATTTEATTPAATTPAVTTPAVTTPAPVVPLPKWVVKDDKGKPCILADFNVVFNGFYTIMTVDNKTEVAPFSFVLPPSSKVDDVNSKCGTPGSENAVLVLSFDDGDSFTQEFKGDTKSNTFVLYSASANLTHDDAHFNGSSDPGKVITYGGLLPKAAFGTNLGKYYRCVAKENVEFTEKKFAIAYTNLTIQPFDVKDKFGNMSQCAADTPTIKPDTPPTGSWNITNKDKKLCMRMSFAADLFIEYEMKNGSMGTVGFYLPVKTLSTSGSTCINDTAVFVMKFAPVASQNLMPWTISMTFNMDKNKKYALTNFTVDYETDSKIFPNVKEQTTVKSFNDTKRFETAQGNYYLCDADTRVNASNFRTEFTHMKLQPFAGDIKGGSYGTASDCAADNTVSNIVPIAVGCALAGLVIIVLIAYLIGRSRTNRSGYQSV